MSTIFFLQKMHPQEGGKAYFLGVHEKPEEKLGKCTRLMMMISFNGSPLGRGLIRIEHKKPLLKKERAWP
jgi:hypothetical protein